MTRPVQWSREALDDIKRQIAYIATDNPGAARRIADRIRETGMALGKTATGRPGRVTGAYEKLVTGLPYIIAYAIATKADRETVSILRVIHTARDWPTEKWPE
ncbi:type II toxin-antitoxin system RelE/ParE family toxin [Methylovirgula sp. HY1]|uniref:type II toxin-antitoxin system RelE/ParE family toxin n=1 Tax=Methylovirgula sp. HY1 TaxID=2822761 RepID=UPI001C5BEA28|nr:type II toxin-antitoxin system RelE/ParE family toxin [Methylovirgula sp. HY1]QXX76598.1 hypothetical protein MHY1_p00120 [Methylovirgula sp. HY1]